MESKYKPTMKKAKSFITLISFILILCFTGVAQTVDLPPGVVSGFQPQSSGDANADAGKKAIYEGKWQEALDAYSKVIKSGGAHVDEALYWQAYSQNKLGQRSEALNSISRLKRDYPHSQWLKDAG